MTDLESKVASQTNKKEEERKKWPARFLPHSLSQHLGPSCEVFTACLFILPRGASSERPSPLPVGSGMIVEPVEISTLHDCFIVIASSIVLDNNTNNHNNLGFLSIGREGITSFNLGVAILALQFPRCEGLARPLLLSGLQSPVCKMVSGDGEGWGR